MTVEAEAITGRRAWPSYTPETFPGAFAARNLLLHCQATGCWEEASNTFLASFLPSGTLLWSAKDKKYCMSLGPVGLLAFLTWPVKA
eukprot:4918399-Lingulodinium_polyedra.AAC.1